MGLTPHPMPGATRTAIGITGNTGAVDPRTLEVLPGVLELIRVTKPYKLASREMHEHDTVVRLPQGTFGDRPLHDHRRAVLGRGRGDDPAHRRVADGPRHPVPPRRRVQAAHQPVRLPGAGPARAWRSSPRAATKTGIGIVTELMDTENADAVEEAADIIQIGTRNMQNFSLLRRVAQARKPVLLKRGMSATLEEWLMSAEYLLSGGNHNVILCERGVRTFSDHSRNTLDLSVIPPAKALSHLPILVDPSHGTGKRDYVPPMALAALAAGADGLLIEVHPDPDHALSDGAQSLDFAGFEQLLGKLKTTGRAAGTGSLISRVNACRSGQS